MEHTLKLQFEDSSDLKSLASIFVELTDQRKRRGIRYELPMLLILIVLAKLCGSDTPSEISGWIGERSEMLKKALNLKWKRMPHHSTYRRILQRGLDIEQFEEKASQYLQSLGNKKQEHKKVESLLESADEVKEELLAMDGKTMRGTIATGESQGLHLLSIYEVSSSRTMAQVSVDKKENEISAAPRLLKKVDLTGRVVTGDALLAQRSLSQQIVESGGDYLWVIKDNHPNLRADIARLFTTERHPALKSESDFRAVNTVDKAHGRIEQRTLTASTTLNNYLEWPHLGQVFEIKRETEIISKNVTRSETVYGVTSLGSQDASAARLLALNRGHWGIENGLHHRRDVTFNEDACRIKSFKEAEAIAVFNNLSISLIRLLGWINAAEARRHFCANVNKALQIIFCSPQRL